MLQITSIKNGFMLDHIKAGIGVKIFRYLHLDKLGHQVALITGTDEYMLATFADPSLGCLIAIISE